MKCSIVRSLAGLLCIFPLTLSAQTDIKYMGAGGKLNPLQAGMDIRHYTLSLEVDIPNQSIEGYAEIRFISESLTDTFLFDLTHILSVRRVVVDLNAGIFSQEGDSLWITSKARFEPGKHVVRVYYGGRPPVAVEPPWEGGFTWAKDKQGNPWVSINCQLQGAKVFFPCKDHPGDEPDEGADLFITISQDLSVAGPGLLQGVKKRGRNKATWHWKTNYTVSNYCIVFNIAKYKLVTRPYTTCEGNIVPMHYYALEENAGQADRILDIKERDTRILEKYFGEYPWVREKIGLAEVPNSGMEHQTMVTYSGTSPFTHTTSGLDYSGELFHEYAHEWWANKVTNKDWAYMWIQEGITTYAEALAMKETGGEAAYDSLMLELRTGIENIRPIQPEEGMNMNDINWDIYPKGAFLMHTLRYLMGDALFFPALKKFITDVRLPYNQFFSTEDVLLFFNQQSGKELRPLFDFYLKTTQTIDIELYKIKPDTYMLHVANSPMLLPLDIATDTGIIHTQLTTNEDNNFKIISKTQPVIDPRNYYFKKVIIQ